jgi:hypothetical protein
MQPAQRALLRLFGAILIGMAVLLGWKSHWFHVERDLSRYPHIELTYATSRFERVMHSRGGSTKQIVLMTRDGARYVMEDGVWKAHFDGPTLAARLAGGGSVRAWVHPDYPRALRGIIGGAVDIRVGRRRPGVGGRGAPDRVTAGPGAMPSGGYPESKPSIARPAPFVPEKILALIRRY